MGRDHFVPSWRHDAACAGAPDPELWFPIGEQRPSAEALATCRRCPVRVQCARHAGADGVWAGFTLPGEKDQLRAFLARVDQDAADIDHVCLDEVPTPA